MRVPDPTLSICLTEQLSEILSHSLALGFGGGKSSLLYHLLVSLAGFCRSLLTFGQPYVKILGAIDLFSFEMINCFKIYILLSCSSKSSLLRWLRVSVVTLALGGYCLLLQETCIILSIFLPASGLGTGREGTP